VYTNLYMNIWLVKRQGGSLIIQLPVKCIVIFDYDIITHGKRGQCDFVVDIVDFELWECDEVLARVVGEFGVKFNNISIEW